MQEFEWIAPCHFGTEAVCKKEIMKLGYEITEVSLGNVEPKAFNIYLVE
mgnify:CR=1 FL=1